MKVVIAGSRGFNDYDRLRIVLNKNTLRRFNTIISGGAKGVDTLAERLANDLEFSFEEFLADWDKHGKAAGPIRNNEMLNHADHLITVWDGKSKGTSHIMREAQKRGIPYTCYQYEGDAIQINFDGERTVIVMALPYEISNDVSDLFWDSKYY